MLSKDQILKAEDLRKQKVAIPEWGGDLFVREMTAKERDDYRRDLDSGKDKLTGASALLAVRVIVNDKNERLFEDKDAPELAKKSASALDKVLEAALSLSGLNAQDIEELEKNSESGQSEDSHSD